MCTEYKLCVECKFCVVEEVVQPVNFFQRLFKVKKPNKIVYNCYHLFDRVTGDIIIQTCRIARNGNYAGSIGTRRHFRGSCGYDGKSFKPKAI